MIASQRLHSFIAPLALALGISIRLAIALILSVSFHAIALVGVSFKAPEWNKAKGSANLEVVLVNSKSARKPSKADALAQSNLDGGGNTDAKRRAQSPLPALEREQARVDADALDEANLVARKEQEAQVLLTQVKSKATVKQPAEKTAVPDGKPDASPNIADLRQRSLDMARLEAQIAQNMDKYQERPKRKFIGARTQEYRFARYVEDWRAKVEKVGNLNYPEEARRNKTYGSLALTVSIRANGEVESIEVSRPSGHRMLDEAATRIVRLAAPYAAFPDDIRRDTDIVSITRTWMFTKGDQLTTEN